MKTKINKKMYNCYSKKYKKYDKICYLYYNFVD